MSKRKTPGAGHVPAPRAADDIRDLAEELRAAAREAREALGDLQRERKAIEQLARDKAEEVIASHVNSCIDELARHINRENIRISKMISEYQKTHLDHLIKEWTGLVDVRDLVDATLTLKELKRLAVKEQEREEGNGG